MHYCKFLCIFNYALDIPFCSGNLCVFAIVFPHGYGYCMRGGWGDPVILSPRVWAPATLLDHTRGDEYLLDLDHHHHHWYDGHRVHRRRDEMFHKKQVVGWLDAVEAKSEFIPYMEPCPAYDPASQHRCNWDHLIHIWYQYQIYSFQFFSFS